MRLSRYVCLAVFGIFCLAVVLAAEPRRPTSIQEAVRWLEGKSREMIHASRRPMKSGISAVPPQAGSGYEAFWLRDYVKPQGWDRCP